MYTVKQIRVELGLNQTDLAKLLGMHHNTYRKKENGLVQWTIQEASKLCAISGQPITNIKF